MYLSLSIFLPSIILQLISPPRLRKKKKRTTAHVHVKKPRETCSVTGRASLILSPWLPGHWLQHAAVLLGTPWWLQLQPWMCSREHDAPPPNLIFSLAGWPKHAENCVCGGVLGCPYLSGIIIFQHFFLKHGSLCCGSRWDGWGQNTTRATRRGIHPLRYTQMGEPVEGMKRRRKKAEINGESNFHLFYFPEIYWS